MAVSSVFFDSPAFGRVEVTQGTEGESAYGVATPADLEDLLQMLADRGHRPTRIKLHPDAFRQFATCLDGMTLGLSRLADAELRAECERRGMAMHTPAQRALLDELDAASGAHKAAMVDLEEWKRRAEVAEACASSLESRIEGGYLPTIASLQRMAYGERGPGIASLPTASDEHYVDPLDLLCDDE